MKVERYFRTLKEHWLYTLDISAINSLAVYFHESRNTLFSFCQRHLRKRILSYLSFAFKEMTHRLNYLEDIRGIGVFTASPGMDKSYCLRCFAKNLNPNLYQMIYLCLPTISVAEFYKQFCHVLVLSDKDGKTVMFKAFQEQVYYLCKEKRQPLILAIALGALLKKNTINSDVILAAVDNKKLI